jgi:hypothetical protein
MTNDVTWLRRTAKGAFPGGPTETGLLHAADELDRLRAIVTDLANNNPVYRWEGAPYCRYCSACLIGNEHDTESCPWYRARELMAGQGSHD